MFSTWCYSISSFTFINSSTVISCFIPGPWNLFFSPSPAFPHSLSPSISHFLKVALIAAGFRANAGSRRIKGVRTLADLFNVKIPKGYCGHAKINLSSIYHQSLSYRHLEMSEVCLFVVITLTFILNANWNWLQHADFFKDWTKIPQGQP